VIAGWVALNLVLPEFGRTAFDPFPFPLLSAAVSTIGLYLAAMILMTQRHDEEMATRREQITLEPAILSEQKSGQSPRRSGGGPGRAADAEVVLDAIQAAEKAEGDVLATERRVDGLPR
jgi:hypothetical protein